MAFGGGIRVLWTLFLVYFYLSKKIRLDLIHLKHQVLFSLKKNENIFMNVICCSRDWGFLMGEAVVGCFLCFSFSDWLCVKVCHVGN